MQYMLLIYSSEQMRRDLTAAQRDTMNAEYAALTQDLKASGHYKAGSALPLTDTATTLRVRDAKPQRTDGPFAETREHLGGYYVIEAKDLDEATAIAARIPTARYGSIEIRPIMTFES